MKNDVVDPAFYPFFIEKMQARLSGSSVMPIEQAEKLQQSIEFVLRNGEGAGSLTERFEQGKHQLERRLADLRSLYDEIVVRCQSFGIESLEESIKEIGRFFATYDIDFGAAEVDQAFLDYQLAEAVPAEFVGIDFYDRYLHNLAAEVFFIENIPKNQIYELLNHYEQKLGFDYRKDVNNLFEVIFKQVIGRLLIGKKQNDRLLLNRFEAQYAINRIKTQTHFPELEQLFEINSYYLRIFKQLTDIVYRLEASESASNFFITAVPSKKQLQLPPALSATAFNQLLNAVAVADQQEKIRLIVSKISTPEDLIELSNLHPESDSFYKRLFKVFNKNFIETLILFYTDKFACDEAHEMLDITVKDGIFNLLKDYIKTLSSEDQLDLFSRIEEYQLVPADFS